MRVSYYAGTVVALFCFVACGSDVSRSRQNRILNDAKTENQYSQPGNENNRIEEEQVAESEEDSDISDEVSEEDLESKPSAQEQENEALEAEQVQQEEQASKVEQAHEDVGEELTENQSAEPELNEAIQVEDAAPIFVELRQKQGYTADDVKEILSKSKDTCAGPWTFPTYDCFKAQRHETCGVERDEWIDDLSRFGRCRSPQFGVEAYLDTFTDYDPSLWFTSGGLERRNWCKDGAKDILKTPSIRENATKACSEQMQIRIRQKGNRQDQLVKCENLSIRRCHFGGTNSFVDWKGRLKISTPLYNESAGPMCPREKKRNITYKVCRRAEFGRENSNVCGAAETAFYTDANLKKTELPEEHAYSWRKNPQLLICTTCDPLPYKTAKQIEEKASCLLKALDTYNGMRYANEADEAIPFVQTIGLKLQTLFEISKGAPILWDDLVLMKQKTAMAATDAAVDIRDAESALCADLARSHVHPELIAKYFDVCLNESKIFQDQKAWDKASETLNTGFEMLSNAAVQLRDNPNPQKRLAHWFHTHVAQWKKLALEASLEEEHPTIEIQAASLLQALDK